MTASELYNNGNNVSITFGSAPTYATGISLNKTSTSIQRGNTETLTATVTPNNATDRTVTWSTSNPSVVTVSSGGVVTAVGIGTATITATTNDGTNLSASCTVTVYWFTVTGVTVTPATATVLVDGTTTLTANVTPANASNQSVTWSSSNPAVATVNANGVVTGVSVGSATITATTVEGGYTASATITVNPVPVTGVTLDKNGTMIEKSGTVTLTATITPSNATNQNLTWTVSDESIATLAVNGNTATLTASSTKTGRVNVTVTTEDGGYTATSTIWVMIKKTVSTNRGELNNSVCTNNPTSVTFSSIASSSNSNIRVARYSTITVSAGTGNTMIYFTLNGSEMGSITKTSDTGTYTSGASSATWDGETTGSIVLNTNNSRPYITSVDIYYMEN